MSAFYDLPATKYPFTVEFRNAGGDVVHSIEVVEPGAAVVPPLAAAHGPVSVRITWGDGTVDEAEPEVSPAGE